MKKIFFTLILTIWTTILLSQTYAKAVNLTIGIRDDVYSKMTWGDTRRLSGDILIKFQDREILVYTEEIQFYRTLSPEHKTTEYTGSWWYAFDSSGKKCKVYLFYRGGDILMIEYDDACIIYGIIYK